MSSPMRPLAFDQSIISQLGEAIIMARSGKQKLVTKSSTEAERRMF
jgi:hypothetical protein